LAFVLAGLNADFDLDLDFALAIAHAFGHRRCS
jgi:hypothetical protein